MIATKSSSKESFMNRLRTAFILLGLLSVSASANVLNLNCHLDGDEGSYLGLSEFYKNKTTLKFQYQDHSYIAFVSRKSEFKDYKFLVAKINVDTKEHELQSFSTKSYREAIQVDENISCIVND